MIEKYSAMAFLDSSIVRFPVKNFIQGFVTQIVGIYFWSPKSVFFSASFCFVGRELQ